ncbi:MAG: hypothetical protein Q8T08_17845, partial [Ignavibacteria bacterium]|nr:hypothetical protein [Ignavibacteria bacterium]
MLTEEYKTYIAELDKEEEIFRCLVKKVENGEMSVEEAQKAMKNATYQKRHREKMREEKKRINLFVPVEIKNRISQL